MWYIIATVILAVMAAKYSQTGPQRAVLVIISMWGVLTLYLMGVRP